MFIKGKKASVQSGRSQSNSFTGRNTRPEVQRHWPGLLPTAYADPSLVYGTNPMIGSANGNKRELKMPAIINNSNGSLKPQTAKPGMGSTTALDDSIYPSVQKNLE